MCHFEEFLESVLQSFLYKIVKINHVRRKKHNKDDDDDDDYYYAQ